MPTSSLIFDYDYSNILSPTHNDFTSDSFTRLSVWKYDEALSYATNEELANTEKIAFYMLVSPSGGLIEEIAGTAYLCAPFMAGSHLGINSGIYNSFNNELNYTSHYPIAYMNQLILDMQDKYLLMDSNVRTNSRNTMTSYLPYSTVSPEGYNTAPYLLIGGTVQSPSIPVSLSMKLLDLSDGSNFAYQWGDQFIKLTNGTPVESGAGPINRMLKRIINPLVFVKNMAVNVDVENGRYNDVLNDNIYPINRQVAGGTTQKVNFNFGVTDPAAISIHINSNSSNTQSYNVNERDSGNGIDYGHERLIGTIDLMSRYVMGMSYGSSGLAVDSNGVFFPDAGYFNKDWTYNSGSLVSLDKTWTINMSDRIYRAAGVPYGDTWYDFLYNNFNYNTQLFTFSFQNFFHYKPVPIVNYDIPLIPKFSATATHSMDHDTSIYINGNNIPFVDSSTDAGSGLIVGSVVTGSYETYRIYNAFLSGNVTYTLAGYFGRGVSNYHIYNDGGLPAVFPVGYGANIRYGYEFYGKSPRITVYCRDIHNNKHEIVLSNLTVPSGVDSEGYSPYAIYGLDGLSMNHYLKLSTAHINDFDLNMETLLPIPSNFHVRGNPSYIGESGLSPSPFYKTYNSHFIKEINGGLFGGIDGYSAFKSIQNIGYEVYSAIYYAKYNLSSSVSLSDITTFAGGPGVFATAMGKVGKIFGDGGAVVETFNEIGAYSLIDSLGGPTINGVRYKHKNFIESNTSYIINDAYLVMDIHRYINGVFQEADRSITPISITLPANVNDSDDPIVDDPQDLNPTNVMNAWWL